MAPRAGGPRGSCGQRAQPAGLPDEVDDLLDAVAGADVGEDERALAAHASGVARPSPRGSAPTSGARSILLMTSRSERVMPGPPLRGILSPAGDVDDVDREVGELGAEGGGEVVAAGFDEDQVELREARGACASTAARLIEASSRIAVCGQPPVSTPMMRSGGSAPRAGQELGVLLGVDVVGDDGDVVARRAGACTARRPARSCRSRPGRRCRRAAGRAARRS